MGDGDGETVAEVGAGVRGGRALSEWSLKGRIENVLGGGEMVGALGGGC